MKFKDNKISFSIILLFFIASCSSAVLGDSEVKDIDELSDVIDTTFSIEDLYFLEGDWVDSVTFKLYGYEFFDTWSISNDSIIGKALQFKIDSLKIDTLSEESMAMVSVGDRIMYIIRKPDYPVLVYPSFKKSGDSLIFKNMANESLQEIIFINESSKVLKLLLRGYKADYKREVIYNYKRI
jgi:hypothetical protein